MREKWKFFFDKRTGRTLAGYTLRGPSAEEEAETINLLAAENGITPDDISAIIEERPGEGVFYYLDCLDGIIGARQLTAAEISEIETGRRADLAEKEIIRIAANYEATLYRQEYAGGDLISETVLYEAY